MKNLLSIKSVTLALLFFAAAAFAAEKVAAGPKGGRMLECKPARAEFFVNKERKVEISFYDADLKPVAPAEQSVEVRVGKDAFEFDRQGETFVSKTPLPAGHELLIVVRVTAKPGDKPQNFRVPFHEGICAGCQRAEYACTCDHHGDDHDGHHH